MRLLVLALLVRVFGTAGHEPKCGAGGGGYNEDDEELAVRRLYEAAPYPPRLHGRHQEGHRVLVECLPDVVNAAIPELSLFAEARFSRQRPLRILVAGGGTGDPTLACAHSFHLAEIHVHIVHLDLSARSTNIARQRVGNLLERSLADRITFVRGSIAAVAVAAAASQSNRKRSHNYWHSTTGDDLDVNNPRHASDIKALFAQPFDYIHSTGVLHHSRSPEQSLRLLTSLLHQDGGMALWVYASPGRDGVHDFQRMMKILAPRTEEEVVDMRHVWGTTRTGECDETITAARKRLRKKHAERLEVAWDLLANLPSTNRLVRNPVLWNSVSGWLTQHEEALQSKDQDDKGEPRWDVRVSDMFLNPVDREFSVHNVVEWLAGANLEPAKWLDTESGNFDVNVLWNSEHVVETVSGLDEVDRLALGELLQGTAVGHRVIARKATNNKKSEVGIVPPMLMS